MPDAIMKALATITEPDTADDSPYGGFTAVLSTPTMDRDDDELKRDEWVEPLPKSISIDIDHTMSVEGTVGSGRPYFDDSGRLMLDAKFANTEKAQMVRSLVKDGHVGAVSVAFLNRRNEKGGKPQRELLNAGIVAVPANPDAVILSSKALDAVEQYVKAAKKDDEKATDDGKVTDEDEKASKDDGPFADPGYLDADGKPAKDGNGQPRYKIDNEAHTRAAWSYINMPKNSKFYSAEQLAKIKDKIKAAAEKFGIKIDDDDDQKAFDRVIALTDEGLTFGEVCKALDLDADAAVFLIPDVPQEKSTPEGPVQAKAGARNSAPDTKMIQAIHDASSLLGAQCVSEPAPDEDDGSAEGANKSVRSFDVSGRTGTPIVTSYIVGKSLNGSLEDMQCRLQNALSDASGAGNWDGCYPFIVATYMNPDGNGGSVVYRVGGETLCRAFSDDGTTVCLDSNIQVVTLITSVAAIPDTVDGDPTPLPPAAAEAGKSAGALSATVVSREGMGFDEFKAALEAIPGLSEHHITLTPPTETTVEKSSGSEPGSPASPVTDTPVPPDSKAASDKDPANDESADTDEDSETADDEAEEKEDDTTKRLSLLRSRLIAANARAAMA